MSNTDESQELISTLERYTEQLILEAYARASQNENDELSDEILKEIADAVERQLIAAVKTSIEPLQNPVESISD